jgi:hypothetical protein
VTPALTTTPPLGALLLASADGSVFSDNAAFTGIGMEIKPVGAHFRLAAEANLAFNFVSAFRSRSIEPDYRIMFGYSREWAERLVGPIGAVTLGHLKGERLFSAIDASAGFYSRYGNDGIAYLQARDGIRVNGDESARIAPYIAVRLVKDTHGDYFNNAAEAGAGLEVHHAGDYDFSVRGEYLYGFYYENQPIEANPYGARYHTLRLTFTFGHRATIVG